MSTKYRIEPKPEGRRHFKAIFEGTEEEVKAWLANPPIPTTTCIRGTNGTYHQLATASRHHLVVTEQVADTSRMNDRDQMPMYWRESNTVTTVASMETADGCRLIERWDNKPAGSLTPSRSYDR